MFNRKIIITRRNPWRTIRPRRLLDPAPKLLLLTASQNFMLAMAFSVGAPVNWQMTFQRPATNIMVELIELHHDIMTVLIVIVCFVGYFLLTIIEVYSMSEETRNIVRVSFSHHALIEKIWTFIPSCIVLWMMGPSWNLLYHMDELEDPGLTVRIIGRQWYWVYEVFDPTYTGRDWEFESYLVALEELKQGQLRLLDVTEALYLPVFEDIRLLITSSDVLHSWAVPALGIKMDACPGRLNQVGLNIGYPGVFYGQCSELCGVYHGFMPISVHGVNSDRFIARYGVES